jgi:hypothetical protein
MHLLQCFQMVQAPSTSSSTLTILFDILYQSKLSILHSYLFVDYIDTKIRNNISYGMVQIYLHDFYQGNKF